MTNFDCCFGNRYHSFAAPALPATLAREDLCRAWQGFLLQCPSSGWLADGRLARLPRKPGSDRLKWRTLEPDFFWVDCPSLGSFHAKALLILLLDELGQSPCIMHRLAREPASRARVKPGFLSLGTLRVFRGCSPGPTMLPSAFASCRLCPTLRARSHSKQAAAFLLTHSLEAPPELSFWACSALLLVTGQWWPCNPVVVLGHSVCLYNCYCTVSERDLLSFAELR